MIADARILTSAQEERLEKLADEWPDAKVIDWFREGPVIRAGEFDKLRTVNPSGRMAVVSRVYRERV